MENSQVTLGRVMVFKVLTIFVFLFFSLSLLPSTVAAGEEKSGVSPSKLKLPKGPGSIEGIGENAEPNLNMGLVSYGVPIALPGGYRDFSPSLDIGYNSGAGNSMVGMGWSLGIPRIERMTARGLPLFNTTDLFATDSGDELVRLAGTQAYRSRYEGGFVRYGWVDSVGDGQGGYWKAEYPDGRVGYFGADASGQLHPEARIEGAGGTFAYYLVEIVDPLNHEIAYRYESNMGQPYLVGAAWAFKDGQPRYEVALTYEEREDILSDGKPGLEIRLGRRLSGIRVMVNGVQLRRYALGYEPYEISGGLSRLQSVTLYGSDDTPYPVLFKFGYTDAFDPNCDDPNRCGLPQMFELGSVGQNLGTGEADLVDLNGDNLPDVIDTREGNHVVHLNSRVQGDQRFDSPVASQVATGGSLQLSSPHVQMVDLNGDARADMIDTLSSRVLWNNGDGDWSADETLYGTLPRLAEDAYLRFFDYDNDRLIDVMHMDGESIWYLLNRGGGTFDTEPVVGAETFDFGFDDPGVQLADMNGDGLQDLARPLTGALYYYMNLGRGRFSETIEMLNLPATLEPEEMRLVDINGDGLSDVVVLAGNAIQYALNRNGRDFGDMVVVDEVLGGVIPEQSDEMSVRFADMNGSGSTDIVWFDPSGNASYLEIFSGRPNLLASVENGIGKTIRFYYGSSTVHMARDATTNPWRNRLPHAMLTLDRLDTCDALTRVCQVQEFEYRNGYYDGEEKQFRGFADVRVTTIGDASIEPGAAVYHFDVGEEDPYYRGRLLTQATLSDDQEISTQVNQYEDCGVAEVPESTPLPVRFICLTRADTVLKEGAGEEAWVTTSEEYGYDGYGNQTQVAKLGVTAIGGVPCGDACIGDDLFEEAAFIEPSADTTGGRWMLRSVYRTNRYGASAPSVAAEELTYYDGQPFVGLSLGTLSHGLVSRVTAKARADDDRVIDSQRFAFDNHGNVTSILDPNGHERTLEYDDSGLFPVAEQLWLDDPGHEPYALRMELTYDPLLDLPVESTAWMIPGTGTAASTRRSTTYGYDGFGRMVALAKPGDTLSTPTQQFTYDLGDPVSRIVMRSRSRQGGEPDLEAVQCFDGLGRKFQERTRIAAGKYQVSGYTEFNIQGKENRVYQPYLGTESTCDTVPPTGGLATSATFDATGRPVTTTRPDSAIYGTASVEVTKYGPLSTSVSDAEDVDQTSPHYGTPTITRTDGQGRTTSIERFLTADAAPSVIAFTYDSLGRIDGLIDAYGNRKSQHYDLLGRVLDVDDPDTGTTTYRYDDAGNLLESTDARNVTVQMTYDEANRPMAKWDKSDPEATLVEWFYDAWEGCDPGRCTNTEGQNVGVRFPLGQGAQGIDTRGYDDRGRPVYESRQLDGYRFEFENHFDNADRQTGTTYPTGRSLTQVLDGAGRVTGIPGFQEATYTDRGQVDTLSFGNGAITTHTYDALTRLSSLTTTSPQSTVPLQSYGYTFDRVSNILEIEAPQPADNGPSGAARYGYDAYYRLLSANLDPGRPADELMAYQYDEIDNIISKVSSLGEKSKAHAGVYSYDGASGPHAVDQVGSRRYEYDAAGNTVVSDQHVNEWDHDGRLVKTTFGPRVLTESTYSDSRQRVARTAGAEHSFYIRDDFDVRDGIATVYVTFNGTKVAQIESSLLVQELLQDGHSPSLSLFGGDTAAADASRMLDNGETVEQVRAAMMVSCGRILLGNSEKVTYLHQNHLRSTSVTTDSEGRLLNLSEYYPFGQIRLARNYSEEFGFTGEESDSATGVNYHSSRYLDLLLGLWTSPDPMFVTIRNDDNINILEQAHRYEYVFANPVGQIDPTGECTAAFGGDTTCSEVADYLNDSASQASAILEQAVQNSDGGLGAVVGATIVQTAMDVGSGYVDMLRLGEGAAEGGWGIVRDTFRAIGIAGSVGQAFRAFSGATTNGALATRGTALARRLGRAGETASGITKNTKHIPSLSDTAKYRIPDGLTRTTLTEVKNVSKLSYTNQLKDFSAYTKETGRQFELFVRSNTRLSEPLKNAVKAKDIILRYLQ